MSQPQFVDSHCHLNYEDFKGDVDAIIKNARMQGIKTMLTICTNLSDIDGLKKIAESDPEIYASVGIHPHDAEPTLAEVSEEELIKWILSHAKHEKVIGIGECGLDYYYDNSPRKEQQKVFIAQLKAAQENDLPVIVHTRSANEDTISILKEYGKGVRGVIHCFSETQWLADQALDLGFYISLSGILTFSKAQSIRDTVKTVPLDRLLLETDAPFLAPVPMRGKRNEPAFLIHTAEVMAELKEVELPELSKITTDNFYTLFNKATN